MCYGTPRARPFESSWGWHGGGGSPHLLEQTDSTLHLWQWLPGCYVWVNQLSHLQQEGAGLPTGEVATVQCLGGVGACLDVDWAVDLTCAVACHVPTGQVIMGAEVPLCVTEACCSCVCGAGFVMWV